MALIRFLTTILASIRVSAFAHDVTGTRRIERMRERERERERESYLLKVTVTVEDEIYEEFFKRNTK